MNTNYSIRFYLNINKAKGARKPIYLRITVDRRKVEMVTPYKIEAKEWEDNRQRTRRNVIINQGLNQLESEVHEVALELKKKGRRITADNLRAGIKHTKSDRDYLVRYYQEHLLQMAKAGEVKAITIDIYRYTLQHVMKFLRDAKHIDDIPLWNVDYKFINDLDVWLMSKDAIQPGLKLERNTVSKHHSRLRTVLIRAFKEGLVDRNPYGDFKLKQSPSNRTYLDEAELERLNAHDLAGNQSLIKVRDIFMFSVYTGLRFEDAQLLTLDKIIPGSNGKFKLSIDQGKTERPLVIPLVDQAMEIVQRYVDAPGRKIQRRVLPTISNQKLNTYLKVIADLVGIDKRLTHHVARHTCATTFLLSKEIPLEVVSRWLGHTNIKTTQVYAKVTDNYLEKVASKLNKKSPE